LISNKFSQLLYIAVIIKLADGMYVGGIGRNKD